jgi:hypothetical protein
MRATLLPLFRLAGAAALVAAGFLILAVPAAHADWRGGGGGGWHGGGGWNGGGWRGGGGWGWRSSGWGWRGGGWGCCWRGGVFIGLAPPVFFPPPVYYAPPPVYYPPPYYGPYGYAYPGY